MAESNAPKPRKDADKAARRLDERIRKAARSVEDQMAELAALIAEAKKSKIHKVLGFPTWPSYVADVASKDMPLMHKVARTAVIKMLLHKVARTAVIEML
jgi:hypothetical protein